MGVLRVLMMTEHDRGFTATRLDEYRRVCAETSTEKILIVLASSTVMRPILCTFWSGRDTFSWSRIAHY